MKSVDVPFVFLLGVTLTGSPGLHQGLSLEANAFAAGSAQPMDHVGRMAVSDFRELSKKDAGLAASLDVPREIKGPAKCFVESSKVRACAARAYGD